jgi:hypothetical protein
MMRRNSAAFRQLEAAANELFAGAGPVLFVGAPAAESCGAVSASDLNATEVRQARWAGAVWVVESELHAGIAAIRAQLEPTAKLLLVQELGGRLLARAKELVGGRARPVYSREELCAGVLASGLLEPGVWLETPRLLAVRGTLPRRPDVLDAFFTQPPQV